jgi:hypothetical protein
MAKSNASSKTVAKNGQKGPASPGLSPKFMATSVAATLNITAGVLGLVMPENFPALARPTVAITLILIGVGLEIWAVKMLIAAHRAQDELLPKR